MSYLGSSPEVYGRRSVRGSSYQAPGSEYDEEGPSRFQSPFLYDKG